ncbi:hypothetical protein LCGC14_3028790 [marine sediment metagenome]|uniref:Uncharacterized protein n=1 Tax=marine sediment metagenome TaxID=412755 RepID=A0A0F8Z0U1_9ZZZZ
MEVAVIYEESYVLYGERANRSIHGVVVQHPNESQDEFMSRVKEEVDSLKSHWSYYEWEMFEYIFPDED